MQSNLGKLRCWKRSEVGFYRSSGLVLSQTVGDLRLQLKQKNTGIPCSHNTPTHNSCYKSVIKINCVGLLVVTFDCSAARLTAPAVTITSILLCSNKRQNEDIVIPANPGLPGMV